MKRAMPGIAVSKVNAISQLLVCCLLILVGAEEALAALIPKEPRPYRIGRITIHRKEVFGAKAGWFGSFANQFHVLTREDVIRNELLFKEGDVYDPELLDETERNLRALGIIGDVSVVADTVRNRRVNISVHTHDRWTLGLDGSYKQEGGVRDMGFALNDDNFMGSGQGITLGYNYRSDRNNPHGAELGFVERRLFGTRFAFRARYVNSEDAKLQSIWIERGFYQEAAPWAGALYADFGKIRFRQFQNGAVILQDHIKRQNQSAWGAISLGGRTKFRPGLAYIRARLDSRQVPVTYFDRLDLLNAGLSISRRVFYKGRFIENFGRVEDVPLGYGVNLVAGKNFRFSKGTMADLYIRFDGEYSLGLDKQYYFNFHTTFSGFRSGRQFKDATLQQTILAHWRATERSTVVGKIGYTRGHNWSAARQLILGAATGLPGYPTHAFNGQQQLLMNFQYRIYPPLTVWIFNVGGAFFAASGTAWNADQHLGRQRLHSSAGFGFRIENSAQQGSGIIRIDFPFNFDERRFTEVVISSDQLFKAFSDIMYTPPNVIH
jgi:hypothetical protein